MESSAAAESNGLDAATPRRHPIRHGIGWLLGIVASALFVLLAYGMYAVLTDDSSSPYTHEAEQVIMSLLAVVTFIVSTAAVGLIWYGAEGSRGRWGKRL
ncbi:MAG TPA: hypothetical protein VLG28_07215, partial [Acidimicrobiia bacterium]|nr:hypothetical protein [Acidimicrobiia bacterium]